MLFVCVGVLVYNVSNISLLVFQRVRVYYFFGALFCGWFYFVGGVVFGGCVIFRAGKF